MAEQPLRRAGVVGDDVAEVARLPAGVADRVAGVDDLELGELLDDRQIEALLIRRDRILAEARLPAADSPAQ